MSPSRADDPSLGVTRNSTSPLPCPEAGDNPEIQFTALDTVHAHSGCVAIDNLAAPPPASTTEGFASDTPHLTGPGPVPVTVVVEDALQPAVTAAANKTTATSRDGRRLTRTPFDAGLRIIADFRRSLARARSAQRSSKSYSIEDRPSAEALSSGDHHNAEHMAIFPRPRARYSSTFVRREAASAAEAVESSGVQKEPRRGQNEHQCATGRIAEGRRDGTRERLTASRSPLSSRCCSHRRRDSAPRRRSLHLR